MRNTFTTSLAALALVTGAASAQAQVAGSTLVGLSVSVTEVREIANGLSV